MEKDEGVKYRILVKSIAYGVVTGIIYYMLFAYIIPQVLYKLVSQPLELSHKQIALYLGLFISLGVAERTLKHPLIIPLKALSKIIGALIAVTILNLGNLQTTIKYQEYTINATINISPILLFIVAISLIYGIIDAYSTITTLEKT